MPSTTSSRMPWLVLLALAWRAVAHVPNAPLLARQDTPILDFVGVSGIQLTSCASASFSWVYTGPDSPLTIFISDVNVPQSSSSSPVPTATDFRRNVHRRGNVLLNISGSISPFVDGVNLTALAVPQGTYELIAIVDATNSTGSYVTYSPTFTVQQGSDTSCLTSSSSSSSSASGSSLSTSSSTASSSVSTTTTNDVSSSASSSPTVVPVGGVSNTPVNKGAIAGGVVAGVIVIILALGFYIFFVARTRRNRGHARAPSGARANGPGKDGFGMGSPANVDAGRWGGLGSVDSHAPLSDPKVQKPYVSTRQSHQGRGMSQDDINSYLSRSGSVQYGGYGSSPSEEKFAGSPSEEMVLSTLPYRSPDSNATNGSKTNVRSYSGSSVAPSEHHHRHSQSHAGQPSLDSSASHGQSPFASPPAVAPINIVRSSSTGQNASRKTARKPVPAYTDAASSPATSPVSSPSPLASSATPFADPVPPIPAETVGHYSTRAERESLKSVVSKKSRSKSKLRDKERDSDKSNGSSTNASSEELARQELAHKNSFGPGGVEGKPLHYLMPDMPVGH